MNKLFSLLLLGICCCHAQRTKVMTYNLRLDIASDGENRWDLRKDFLTKQVAFYHPDFMGTQEGKINQLQYIDSTLVDYAYIGVGRDSSPTQGEFSALFYDATKYRVIRQNTFWLSETPEKVSKGWDAAYERICTWGLFEDIKTKKRVYVFNTHLDHMGETARINGARLIMNTIMETNKEKLPVILTGDFNSDVHSQVYLYLSSHMNDTKVISEALPFGPDGTFNNFEFNKPVTLLIDHIFTSFDNITVQKYAVLSDSKNCRYPSDHLPVYIEITIRK